MNELLVAFYCIVNTWKPSFNMNIWEDTHTNAPVWVIPCIKNKQRFWKWTVWAFSPPGASRLKRSFPLSCRRNTRRRCSAGTSSCRVWASRLGFSRSCGARRGLCWSRSRSTLNRLCYCSASNCAASSNSGGWAARRTPSGKTSWRYEGVEKAVSWLSVLLTCLFLKKIFQQGCGSKINTPLKLNLRCLRLLKPQLYFNHCCSCNYKKAINHKIEIATECVVHNIRGWDEWLACDPVLFLFRWTAWRTSTCC